MAPTIRVALRFGRLALALALAGAAPAGAATLPPSDDPLPGSSFQAADGNQVPAAPLADWASLPAGRVTHAPDPNEQDSAFKGGSKEDEPGEWSFDVEPDGVSPGKANILDAWASVDQFGSRTFLYLGFARQGSLERAAQGTTFLTFELNRDGRLWDNGHGRVPCRRTGDVLISYEPHGHTVGVIVQRWVTTKWDTDSGCATHGRLDAVSGLTRNVDVQGAINRADIANSLPGFYDDEIPPERFGEAGIDLAGVLASVDGGCFAYTSVWMHSRSSVSESSNMQDYVAPAALDLRTCAASGTKFLDRDADGVRDAGERGIPRFVVFADYDEDGRREAGEPFTITDSKGGYVLDDIRPPDGDYRLREDLLTSDSQHDWTCSFPNAGTPGGFGDGPGRFPCGWGPIRTTAEPYPRGRDFGNWFPAQLTLRKELYPPDDPGRFDLLVNGAVWLPDAGDEATTTRAVPPGSYVLTERAVGVPGSDYVSTVECKLGTRRARPAATGSTTVVLEAGQNMQCTFRNVRPPAPAIAIDKAGPGLALAGSTLRYTLRVTNPGTVAFSAAAVEVGDEACDDPPELVAKLTGSSPDASPGTLDPGDTWTYRCSRITAEPGGDCETRVVPNTASVTGTANGTAVEDHSSIDTVLLCPRPPAPPAPPVPPGPGGGGTTDPTAVAPPGPVPPEAGVAGEAAVARIPACVRRGSRVTIAGRKIARVVIRVGGRVVRGLSVRPLDRSVTIRVRRNLVPGSYRVTARITFERGAATAPVTLTRRVRVCASQAPRFTG